MLLSSHTQRWVECIARQSKQRRSHNSFSSDSHAAIEYVLACLELQVTR